MMTLYLLLMCALRREDLNLKILPIEGKRDA